MIGNLHTLLLICGFIFLSSCAGNQELYPVYPKGYFDEWNYDNEVNNFATTIPVIPNNLKKITDGPISYYTWKTIKADILIDTVNNEYFSAYRTMLSSDYEKLNMEGRKYVRTAKNLLNNYLFIVDDRRLIYISEDGARFDNFSQGGINLMFLETDACAEEEKYATYSQAIRGYYSIEGQEMQIHFKGRKDFFVKAIVSEDFNSLKFDKVSLSSEDIDNSDGLRNRYEDFSKIFSTIAQPIFELPNQSDLVTDISFNLNLGLINCDKMHPSLMAKRMEMINALEITDPENFVDEIVSIEYEFDEDDFQYKRHYTCRVVNYLTFEEFSYKFTEVISGFLDDESSILTW